MHPRSFPKDKKITGSVKTPVPVTKPTLPGLSIIVDKNQRTKSAPKKSFIKWKQQHEALFEPKQFRTTTQAIALANKRNGLMSNKLVLCQESTVGASSKFDLDFGKLESIEENQQSDYGCNHINNNFPMNMKRPEYQSMMTFSQLNRVARSEAANFNVPQVGQHEPERFDINCGCQCLAVASSSPIKNDDLDDNHETQSNLQVVESSTEKTIKPFRPMTNNELASIVEEQIDIVEHQKQILKQQHEIFNLQYRIEKLMLINNGLMGASSNDRLEVSPICNGVVKSPNVKPTENGTVAPIETGGNDSPKNRRSIGLMTSLHGNLNGICSSDVSSTENNSPKDTMLERINKIIKNSPPMMNYKPNNRVSPIRTDINISSQTLIYKTSTRNNISVNEGNVADRSFALHLLDMKYHPESPSTTNTNRLNQRCGAIQKTNSKSADTDYVSSNISPDKYDYLMRHGLLKK